MSCVTSRNTMTLIRNGGLSSRFYATKVCGMVPSDLGISRILKTVQNDVTTFFTTAICDIRLTHLSATNVKNIHYPKKDTLNCQTETLCLNLGTKLPWTLCPWEVKVRNRLVTFNTLIVTDTTTNLVKITRVDNKHAPTP